MNKEIDFPKLGKPAAFGTAETTTSSLQAKRTSRFKVFLVWFIVLLPLVWGLYATGQTVAPLIRALLNSR